MRYLLQFLWKNSAFLLFLILELISILLVINLNKYQSAVFSNISNQFGGKIFSSYSNISDYFHLKKANEQLSTENSFLRKQIQFLQFNTDSTNFQSFFLLDTSNKLIEDTARPQFDFISAKVISNSTNRQRNYIMLNKGWKHGVRKNMGIIGPNGIVGVIFETSQDFSSGISLLNIKQSVSARLKSNNELGTLVWDGNSPLYGKLEAVENYVPVSIGDTVITSGFSHIFPGGEYLGTVAEIDEIPGKTAWNIKVKFNTDFKKLYWVSIVRNLNYEQQMDLEAIELEK